MINLTNGDCAFDRTSEDTILSDDNAISTTIFTADIEIGIPSECDNSPSCEDEVISVHSDSDFWTSRDENVASGGGVCGSILSTINVESEVALCSTDGTSNTDLDTYSFLSILSPLFVSDDGNVVHDVDCIEVKDDESSIDDGILPDIVHVEYIEVKDDTNVAHGESSYIHLTSRRGNKGKKKKRKKKTLPPHILRRILEEKWMRRQEKRAQAESEMKRVEINEVKKEEEIKKEECKEEEEVEETLSPATTEETSTGRTLGIQTTDVYRIFIKEEVECVKEEDVD